jgi:hypothetical protein
MVTPRGDQYPVQSDNTGASSFHPRGIRRPQSPCGRLEPASAAPSEPLLAVNLAVNPAESGSGRVQTGRESSVVARLAGSHALRCGDLDSVHATGIHEVPFHW